MSDKNWQLIKYVDNFEQKKQFLTSAIFGMHENVKKITVNLPFFLWSALFVDILSRSCDLFVDSLPSYRPAKVALHMY